MRTQRIGFLSSLALAAFVSACGSVSGVPQSDGGGGHGGGGGSGQDGGSACRNLDEAACRARTDCAAGACSLCGGTPQFSGCYDPAHETPPACLGVACPVQCSSLTDEASCRARPDCQAYTCPDCNGGSRFVGCGIPGTGAACPAIACPQPTCAQVTTKDACEARTDCHSVFVDPHNCTCAALGCCAQFSRCADGDKAMCKATGLACGAATPYCEGPYVISYTAVCFEGCVQSTDCAVN